MIAIFFKLDKIGREMKTYELTLVLTEVIGKDEVKQKKLVTEILKEVGAVVKEKNILGIRDLAYEIKKQAKGWYGTFFIEMPEDKVEELDRIMRLKEEILRYLIIKEEVTNTKDKVRNNSSNI